jgi:3',5'-cyclic-AMP phosphodiesterase
MKRKNLSYSNSDKEKLTIIQVTDTHLFYKNDESMFGVCTSDNFYKVIEEIKRDTAVKPDLFLLTGDLSQDESEVSYGKIVTSFEFFNIPVYWIPGNHDNVEVMSKVFSQSSIFHRVSELQLKFFNIFFIDTKLHGKDEGYLSEEELNFLHDHLKKTIADNKPTIIVMHHHPIKTETPLIDAFILKNAEDFWGVINKFSQVKLIICGHVHGDYRLKMGEVIVESAPATCLQWKKGTTNLNIENKIGYKIYTLENGYYQAKAKLWEPL